MATTYELIASNVLGSPASSVTFSSIPGTFTDLLVVYSARTTATVSANWAIVFINPNASSANGSWRELFGNGASAGSASGARVHAGFCAPADNTASTFGSNEIYIPNYAGSTNKSFSTTGLSENNATSALIDVAASSWSNTNAITSLQIVPGQGTSFATNSSFFLYGITKA